MIPTQQPKDPEATYDPHSGPLPSDCPTGPVALNDKVDTDGHSHDQVDNQNTAAYMPLSALGSATPSSVPVPTDLIGHPRYQILKFLGTGGMGVVYQARHRLMERVVALKVINPHLVANPGMVERFRREVMAAARLQHPNIVTAYDADQANDTHFLIMEYVEGAPLNRVLLDRSRLPVTEACEYVRQAARGLQHAHEKGMVHRDIKPHNLMLTLDGQIKILDFGLARYASEAVFDSQWEDGLAPPRGCQPAARSDIHAAPTDLRRFGGAQDGLTARYAMMGTADYMAPEEGQDARRADIRADIYALGCTLYHLLTGHVPFPNGDPAKKLERHQNETPEPLDQMRLDLPRNLSACVARMMAKDPAVRYQIPAEVAQALTQFTALDERRVLVVEDDAATRASMVLILNNQGFTVDAVGDGREALTCLRSGPLPSLILLDLMMPGMDGWEFLREQKADAGLANIPVVIVSATDPRHSLAATVGAADFIRKPLDMDEIIFKVTRHAGSVPAQRAGD